MKKGKNTQRKMADNSHSTLRVKKPKKYPIQKSDPYIMGSDPIVYNGKVFPYTISWVD